MGWAVFARSFVRWRDTTQAVHVMVHGRFYRPWGKAKVSEWGYYFLVKFYRRQRVLYLIYLSCLYGLCQLIFQDAWFFCVISLCGFSAWFLCVVVMNLGVLIESMVPEKSTGCA